MSYSPSFVSGDWKATCQRCGRIFKGSQLRRTWDGLYVCAEDWEEKHPQLQVRGVRDDQRPPFTVPDPTAGQAPNIYEVSPNMTQVASYSRDLTSGPSSQRANSATVDVGTRYFDTNLGVVVYANGTSWVYANGMNVHVPVAFTSINYTPQPVPYDGTANVVWFTQNANYVLDTLSETKGANSFIILSNLTSNTTTLFVAYENDSSNYAETELVIEVGLEPSNTFIYDTFTDTANTLLKNHTPEVGPSWYDQSNSYIIRANHLYRTNYLPDNEWLISNVTPPKANYIIEANIYSENRYYNSRVVDLWLRAVPAAHSYGFDGYQYIVDSGQDTPNDYLSTQLVRVTTNTISNTEYVLHSVFSNSVASVLGNTLHTIKISANGNAFVASLDGNVIGSGIDATFSNAGNVVVYAAYGSEPVNELGPYLTSIKVYT